MSIQAVAWALEQDLPARPKLVLVSIANHADHTTGYCWLKAETIAKEAACTPRSVYNYVGGLVRNGFIRKALKKGDDGKQRANDYWIMFGRADAAWDWTAHPDEDAGEQEAEETGPSETDDTTSCAPSESGSPGPSESRSPGTPVDMSEDSPGPSEGGFTRYNAEPSKTKPKKEGAGLVTGPPRSYRPPPPVAEEPQGAIGDRQAKTIFVIEGTRAWEAWLSEKRRLNPVWHLTTTKVVDGKSRKGWYFPSLFPPEPKTTGPPTSPTMSEDDVRFIESAGVPIK